jgi:hypothetical protein
VQPHFIEFQLIESMAVLSNALCYKMTKIPKDYIIESIKTKLRLIEEENLSKIGVSNFDVRHFVYKPDLSPLKSI